MTDNPPYDLTLGTKLSERLHQNPFMPKYAHALKKSAVLVPLIWGGHEWQVGFIRRSSEHQSHRSQPAFPGGIIQKNDNGPLNCALREANEEIGLPPDHVEPLGFLEGTPTVTGYWIYPVVGVIRKPWSITIDRKEVDRAFLIPLKRLLSPEEHTFEVREWQGKKFVVHVFDAHGERIWGATGRICEQLIRWIARIYYFKVDWLIPPQGMGLWFPDIPDEIRGGRRE